MAQARLAALGALGSWQVRAAFFAAVRRIAIRVEGGVLAFQGCAQGGTTAAGAFTSRNFRAASLAAVVNIPISIKEVWLALQVRAGQHIKAVCAVRMWQTWTGAFTAIEGSTIQIKEPF